MLFNSFHFTAFFASIYLLYVLCMRRRGWQNVLLLIGSYYFYACWDWRFLGLIWLSTVVDYICGAQLDRRPAGHVSGDLEADEKTAPSQRTYHWSASARRSWLIASLVVNLGILGFFKYYNFFADEAASLLGSLGIGLEPRLLNVVLPVGISFYTFQTLSYTIDVYRGRIRAHRSFLEFAVFVAFFPQLVAGPIVRARDFLPQIASPRRITAELFYRGGFLIFWGLFKKVVIADNLARLVDRVFDPALSDLYGGGATLIAVYAFALQIYCDFSGYTDMARGCARMMGFELPVNFRLPYLASNPVEFWRRWHISLSEWLRDYLYIPLGGSRKGPRRTAINVMLTMLLGGLWHGAGWPFVLWGAFHGLLLAIYKPIMPVARAWSHRYAIGYQRVFHVIAVMVFFHLTCAGWLIFRAESMAQAMALVGKIVTPWPWWILCGAQTLGSTGVWTLLPLALPLIVMHWLQRRRGDLEALLYQPAPVRAVVYTLMFYVLIFYGADGEQPFLYFQF